MATLFLLCNAFLVGAAHALEPDHVAAVSTFISRYPGRRRAVLFSLRWGFGHMLPILALAAVAAVVGSRLPVAFSAYTERLVGVALVGLGVWVLAEVVRGRIHLHIHEHGGVRHAHLHTHLRREDHDHAHVVVAVGMVHGLAGGASALALLPLSMQSSWLLALAYILTFSLGVALAMAVYGVSVNALIERVTPVGSRWLQWTRATAGASSLLLGMFWLLR